MASIRAPLYEDKIVDFILELANVEDKEVSVEELYKEDEFDLSKEAEKANKVSKKKKITKNKK